MKKYIFSFLLIVIGSVILNAQNTPRLVLPVGQRIEGSRGTKFSSNGKFIVISDIGAGNSRLYDAFSGKELKILDGYLLKKTVLNPQSKIELTRSDSGIHVWDLNNEWAQKSLIRINKKISVPVIYNDEILVQSVPDTEINRFNYFVIDIKLNKALFTLTGHSQPIYSINISPSGRYLVSTSWDSTAIIRQIIPEGKPLILRGHSGLVLSAAFSTDERFIVTCSADSTARLFDLSTGKEVLTLRGHKNLINYVDFSPKGNYIFTGSEDKTIRIWDLKTGTQLAQIPSQKFIDFKLISPGYGLTFDPDEKLIVLPEDSSINIWEVATGMKLRTLIGHSDFVYSSVFNHNGKFILSASNDNSVRIWNASNGKLIHNLGENLIGINSVQFSPVNQCVVTACKDSSIRIWNFLTGRQVRKIKLKESQTYHADISKDGKLIVVPKKDYEAEIIELETGKQVKILKAIEDSSKYQTSYQLGNFFENKTRNPFSPYINPLWGVDEDFKIARFSNDEKKVLVSARYSFGRIFDVSSSKVIWASDEINIRINSIPLELSPDGNSVLLYGETLIDINSGKEINKFSKRGIPHFSPDGRYLNKIVDTALFVIDLKKGTLKETAIKGSKYPLGIGKAKFSPHEKEVFVFGKPMTLRDAKNKSGTLPALLRSNDSTIFEIWNLENGKKRVLKGGHTKLNFSVDASFSPDGKYLITSSADHQTILWETATGRKLYTRLQLKGDDYLVYDEHYRFDGTPGAMEKLYFVCGLETTELGQMKDALYVPGLAEKIINGEEINYKKLSDLDFCNALPLLELQKEDPAGREFRIQQRRWPLKQLDIKVRGKTVRSIPAEKLSFKDNQASLQISNAGMEKYLLAGIDNEVELQAVSVDRGIEFRSQSVKFSLPGPKSKPQPKLFMLLIGVNDYKDDELDLNFPVQDARALGNALEQSAAKLLGKENVETYHVQSRLPGQQVYTTPERAGVMKALEEIGRKARTQDVLFIFFAGHGVMQTSGEKAFTFLTADASRLSQVGISTKDLKEWLSPEGPFAMMPNKTILVYDACNSGQAAKELVSVLTRDNDATERRRQIEDLGDKSGLFILSASAPDKPAYEVQGLGQGLLTYSMLYTLKNNPLILDENVEGNGFLNLQKWFLETEREQNRLMSSLGLKQKAQPYGSANIRIGMVDEEVRNGIKLMEEKPLVYCASARNENEEDPLDLKNRVNDFLENGHARGIQSDVAFVPSETPQTNVVKLIYKSGDKKVNCRILIFRNKQKILEQNLEAPEPELVKNIVAELERVCK